MAGLRSTKVFMKIYSMVDMANFAMHSGHQLNLNPKTVTKLREFLIFHGCCEHKEHKEHKR